MNPTLRQYNEHTRTRVENKIEEGQRFLEVASFPNRDEVMAYQERLCEWRNATYGLLEEIYDQQSVQSTYCPSVERAYFKSEMQNEARDEIKAEVSQILDSLRDLLSKCN